MFNKLFAAFQSSGSELGNAISISARLISAIELLGQDYLKDQNMRDAAIDAMIEILQDQKSKPSA